MAEPDVTQILSGPGVLYVAPLGSTLPVVDATGEYPVVWPVAWRAVGYTDSGIDIVYTPSLKTINVDEEASPVGDILTTEKFEIKATLAEATLENLQQAISASTYTDDSAAHSALLLKGGQTGSTFPLTYVMVGAQGPGPGTNKARVVLVQKAIPMGAISLKMTRKDNVKFAVTFEARRVNGQPLYEIVDLTSTAS